MTNDQFLPTLALRLGRDPAILSKSCGTMSNKLPITNAQLSKVFNWELDNCLIDWDLVIGELDINLF